MKLFKGLCIFGAGVLVGTVIGARIVKDKFQKEAEEEIAEMREYYRELTSKVEKNEYEKIVKENKYNTTDAVKNFVDSIEPNNQTTPYKPCKENKEEEKTYCEEPFIIDCEEYGGENGEYDTVSLTYFKDKVLADEVDEVVSYDLVGEENLKIFEEYPECTAIYVRDDNIMVDYEIFRDPYQYDEYKMDFSDVLDNRKPHQL